VKAEPALVRATEDTDTGRFRPGIPAMVLAGVLVLAVVIAGYRMMSGTASGNDVPVRTRVADVPAPEPARPSAVPAAVKQEPAATATKPRPAAAAAAKQQPAPQSTPQGLRGPWAVVAAAYANYDAAERRAKQLARRWDEADVTVFPARGQGSKYMVVIASAGSSREAERLRGRARGAGMPSDTYVTRLRF
jgi:cell division protein FtsN